MTTLPGYISKMSPGESWKSSVAGVMHKQHKKELSMIRMTSATYRELLLRNYAYVREQAKTSFWNDKLSKKMAFLSAQAVAQMTGATRAPRGGTPAPAGSAVRKYCDLCHRVHQGRPCPAAPLTSAQRTRLGANLNQRKYEKALKHCREALAEDPHASLDSIVAAAREHALA